jgi:hypothetical protein
MPISSFLDLHGHVATPSRRGAALRTRRPRVRGGRALCLLWLLVPAAVSGCGYAEGNIAVAAVAGTAVGAYSPAHEIEQVYYLGVFDPHDQLQPQQVYRVTVRGQASAISGMKFGSGWVRADLIDSLTTRAGFDKESDRVSFETGGDKEPLAKLKTGRRLVMFGPEGFREAPKDHRLVIVMGASPEKFFQALDQSIGTIAQVRRDQIDPEITRQLFQERERLRSEQSRLADLEKDVAAELPAPQAAAQGKGE